MSDIAVYSGAMKFVEEFGDQVIFQAENDGTMTWGEPDDRLIAKSQFMVDKRYWELLGKPEMIAVGFSTMQGWEEKFHSEVGE